MPGLYSSPLLSLPWKLTFPDCGLACAEHLRQVIRQTQGEIIRLSWSRSGNGECDASCWVPQAVQEIAKENGALLIADEMQTGFGRTGLMWGCDHEAVVPDVMTVGKGIGGGFPMSALISTDELTSRKPFANPSGSSSSFGNPLAAAAVWLR
jgi:adenosylmethionine-8-amino-7-oxononanoate aminotransferase